MTEKQFLVVIMLLWLVLSEVADRPWKEWLARALLVLTGIMALVTP